jgi:hypothetical protein
MPGKRKVKKERPPGKKQLELYHRLRNERFTRREAKEFSKLWRKYRPPAGGKPRYVPTLQALVDDRRALWAKFDRKAKALGWGSARKAGEWYAELRRLYRGLHGHGNPFVTRDVHGNKIPMRVNPWALYDATQKSLPVQDQWDTPRAGRGMPVGLPARLDADRRYREKALRADIRALQDEIKRTGDPGGRLESQLLSLQYNLKTGSF